MMDSLCYKCTRFPEILCLRSEIFWGLKMLSLPLLANDCDRMFYEQAMPAP